MVNHQAFLDRATKVGVTNNKGLFGLIELIHNSNAIYFLHIMAGNYLFRLNINLQHSKICRGACYMTPIGRVRSMSNDPPGASEMTPLAIDG